MINIFNVEKFLPKKKIFIIGNGPSSKKILNFFTLDNFIALLKSQKFEVICMNKYIKLCSEQSIFPQIYIAADGLINIQLYKTVIKNRLKFSKLFLAWPDEITEKKIIKDKKKGWYSDASPLILNKDKINKLKEVEKKIFSFKNITRISHNITGQAALEQAYNAHKNSKNLEIYIIGYDENYNFNTKESFKITSEKKFQENYFFKNYLEPGEVVSSVTDKRVRSINKTISWLSEKDVKVYNMSDTNFIAGNRELKFEEFVKKNKNLIKTTIYNFFHNQI